MPNFKKLNISEPILKAIRELGFVDPTPIQAQAMPVLMGDATDFLGLAATGTGKTAAFTIPMLEKIEAKTRAVQALVLAPTRELALQIAGQVNLLGKHLGIRGAAVYGGSSFGDQVYALKQGAQVVIGTPGRLVDHIERGTLNLEQTKILILDEADEMISMGFVEEMDKILAAMPKENCNTWLFSATMNPQVSKFAKNHLTTPKQVAVNRKEMLSENVQQFYYAARESDKPEVLCKLIESAENFYGLIFCQTKALVSDLFQFLAERGYKVDSLHGDKDQNSRERTLKLFRDRKINILICTDVASRGIDIKDITHVINYSLPRELENYVHRIGRTARSGKTGIAMNLVSPSHRRLVFEIERFTKSKMVEGKIPGRKEIGTKKVSSLLPAFQQQPFAARAQSVLSDEWKTYLANLTPEEVAARFINMMMPDVFNERVREERYSNSFQEEERPERRERSSGGGGRSHPAARRSRDSRDNKRHSGGGGGKERRAHR